MQELLVKRQRALIAFRVFFVTALLGSFFVFKIGYAVFPYTNSVLYVIVFLYLLSILYSLLLDRVNPILLAYAQEFVDVLSAVFLVFVTGGIESWFSWLLLLIVLSSAIVINKRAGYIVATTAGLLYGILIDLQYYGILPVPYSPNLMEKEFLYRIFSHILGLYLIAYLTGRLISGLERQERDIHKLTVFNKEVIENTPSGLVTTDPRGTVLLFNRAAEEITGVRRSEAEGRDIGAILPFIDSIREQKRAEASVDFGLGEKVIGFTVSAMQDARGRDTGYIGIFQDLTQLKKMSEEIKKKEKLAAVGELSANIAHEIRNPLASLKSSMEMLRESSVSAEKRERLMDIALAEMDRLNTIITDFLEYSKPRAPVMKAFDLNDVLAETLDMLSNRGAPGVSFRREFNGPLRIKADSQKLQQVFWNLGINALDAMPDGGALSVGTAVQDGTVVIIFRDTGEGIKKGDVGKVFFPFYTTKSNGTGLGLSIAYRIVEDHGGHIAVDSTPGEGTEFRIFLPEVR
jgi:two-component system sensor histidine kinase PilS (NtrC family)